MKKALVILLLSLTSCVTIHTKSKTWNQKMSVEEKNELLKDIELLLHKGDSILDDQEVKPVIIDRRIILDTVKVYPKVDTCIVHAKVDSTLKKGKKIIDQN